MRVLFLIPLAGVVFFICCSPYRELSLLSSGDRENKLQQTSEWQSFSETWNEFKNCKVKSPKGDVNYEEAVATIERKKSLLEDANKKAQNLRRLKTNGLITEAEIKSIEEFIKAVKNYDIGTAFPPFQVNAKEYWLGGQVMREPSIISTGHLSKQERELERQFPVGEQERAAYFLKRQLSLLEKLAQQPNCLNWVKEHFIQLLINPKFSAFNPNIDKFIFQETDKNGEMSERAFEDVKLLTPNFVKCWERPMNWDEVVQLKEKVEKALETIEKVK